MPDEGSSTGSAGGVSPEALDARRKLESSMVPPRPATVESLGEWVVERARRLAAIEYAPEPENLPASLARLDYDTYRAIRFRPEAALWEDGALRVQLFHRGFLYRRPVRVSLVEQGAVVPLAFDAARFEYGEAAAGAGRDAAAAGELDWAGFRVHLHGREVAVFLGASYFRLLGTGQVHGLSARGLAIDPGGAEEFPAFREYWLVRPEADSAALTFFALLDSPSVTGAYRFDLAAGDQTATTVEATLFARATITRLGVAPLTSMYLHGSGGAAAHDDYRPRVHDSEGLLAHNGAGDWLWRPLSNPTATRYSTLLDRDPRGFGLVQRHRGFADYLDLEARYERRPSLWVGPLDGWGPGGVELVELPTPSEFHDNIVAAWVPQAPFEAGEERRYRYRLRTFAQRLSEQSLLQAVRTREAAAALPGAEGAEGATGSGAATARRFVVDFGTGAADGVEAVDAAAVAVELPVEVNGGASGGVNGEVHRGAGPPLPVPVVETTSGAISGVAVQVLPGGSGWRATFLLEPDESRPADLRLWLDHAGGRISEIWTYVRYPGGAGDE